MQTNMGSMDRMIRTVVAVLIVALYLGGQISGAVALLLGVVAAAFLVTSAVGWCPAYLPFGFTTKGKAPSPR